MLDFTSYPPSAWTWQEWCVVIGTYYVLGLVLAVYGVRSTPRSHEMDPALRGLFLLILAAVAPVIVLILTPLDVVGRLVLWPSRRPSSSDPFDTESFAEIRASLIRTRGILEQRVASLTASIDAKERELRRLQQSAQRAEADKWISSQDGLPAISRQDGTNDV